MSKRSLTLLETLIAIVLVLAMGALIFPSFMSSLEERSFESAADETNQQLMLARAHAQATGKPVEVTYNPDKSQVQARWFLQLLPNFGNQTGLAAKMNSASDQANGDQNSDASTGDDSLIEQSWACRDLGRGVRFATRPPTDASSSGDSANASASASGDYETLESLGKGQDVRLAVFMPDGSALVGDRVWLNDDKGRVGVFTIDPWSGLPIFKRLADQGDDASSKIATTDDRDQFDSGSNSDSRVGDQPAAKNRRPNASSANTKRHQSRDSGSSKTKSSGDEKNDE